MARIIRARSLLGEFFLQKRVHRFRVGLPLRAFPHLAGGGALGLGRALGAAKRVPGR